MSACEVCGAVVFSLSILAVETEPSRARAQNGACSVDKVEPDLDSRIASRKSPVPGAVENARKLQREMEALAKTAEGVAPKERGRWQTERSLDLAEKAKQAGAAREFLEFLVRSAFREKEYQRPGPYSAFNMTQKTLTALSLSILEQNLVGKEKESLVPSVRPTYPTPYGRPPGGVRGVLNSWSYTGGGDLIATAVAAVDSYRDDRATDFLLELALKESTDGECPPWSGWAIGFLRCHDPRAVKSKLQAACNAAGKPASAEKEKRGPGLDRLVAFGPVLHELEYAGSLEPDRRARYQRIQRMLSYANALTPKYTAAAPQAGLGILVSCWEEGDERFLPHMLQTGTRLDPVLVKAPISPEGWAWLKQQSESGDWPGRVREDLRKLLELRAHRANH